MTNIAKILQLGIAALNKSNFHEAEKLYRTILQIQPMHPNANHNLGVTLYELGKFNEAEKSYQQAIESNPNFAEAYYNYGITLRKLNRLDEARSNYKKAIELLPNFAIAYYNIGVVNYELGNVEEAEANYKKAIELNPKFVIAYNNFANMLKDLGRLKESEINYKKAIDLSPTFAIAHNNLGNILKDQDKFNEAEESYKRAISLIPNFARAHSNLGAILKDLDRLEEAEESYKKAIELNPNDPEFLLNLSIVQDYLNKPDAIISQLEHVLIVDKDNCGLKAGVNLAIFKFLQSEFVISKKYLLASSKIKEKLTSEFKNFKEYYNYLLKILNWHEKEQSTDYDTITNKKIYVIGESHALASHELEVIRSKDVFVCNSLLIMGCKQWHLGKHERNKYKIKFESLINSLSKSSEVLLSIGEIDCRLDDGIIKHNNKHPKKKKIDLIISTIENYLSYVNKINLLHFHKITIQGVPCPNIDIKNISNDKVEELVILIKEFNIILKKKSIEMGFDFLDVYKLSNRGDGFSNKIWHLDNYHLSPEGMKEAWCAHLITKTTT